MPVLAEDGPLRCLVRDAERLAEAHRASAVEADLSDSRSLAPALEGMHTVYYLVHSMEPGGSEGFAERDREAAKNYVEAAREAGVRRTVYLGGIGGDDGESEHLESRREVEELLAEAGPELVALRASMIVGAGSASFSALVRIVERLPVLALPDWRGNRTRPIGIDDVVTCLATAREVEPGSYEIAGPDELTFEQMIEIIAGLLGTESRSIRLPFSNAKLEGAAAAAVTNEDQELMEPLMAGLHGDLLVEHNRCEDVFGVTPASFEDAARTAIAAMD